MAIDCNYKNCSCYIFQYFETTCTAINMKKCVVLALTWAAIFAAKRPRMEILVVHFILNISSSLYYDIIHDPHIMATELLHY